MDCFICSVRLDSVKFMTNHFRLFHGLTEKQNYQCTFNGNCNTWLASLGSLTRHYKGHISVQSDQRILDDTVDRSHLEFASSSSCNNNPTHEVAAAASAQHLEFRTSILQNNNPDHEVSPAVSIQHHVSSLTDSSQEKASIETCGIQFTLGLHNKNNFTRKDVVNIQKSVISDIVNPIVESVTAFFNQHNHADSLEGRLQLASLIQDISNPFHRCGNEQQLFTWLARNDYMSNYEEFEINREIAEKYRRGEICYDEVEITGVLLPLQFQFRKVFEKNNLLLHTLQQIELISNSSELNGHFIHGALWRVKSKPFLDAGKIVIPYFLYIDDSEINNPLGPHTDPVSFIYYSFPVVENSEIYLAAVLKGRDYKEFGNEKCLSALVCSIRELEKNGIPIETSEGTKIVYFVLALFVGDNLGLNTVLGFTSSFNHQFFCRFCKTPKSITQTLSSDIVSTARNPTNYLEDVVTGDVSVTGIKEMSIFNTIDTFHVTTNYAVDLMHDVFEGICHYDLCHIIQYFIPQQYLTLESLNIRKHMFNYGEIEIDHISPEITHSHLNKFHLKMTAREMMCFVHLFPLMIGDLIPEDDEVWLFMLGLLEIIDILLSFEISRDLVERLRFLITKHHEEYVQLFNDTLKPKHHLLLHYCSVILQSGPPRNFWSFRFEAKHKEFKTYARSITSRKNIGVSLAKKFQLKFAYFLMQADIPVFTIQSEHALITKHMDLIEAFSGGRRYHCFSMCNYKSKKYRHGFFICQYLDAASVDNVLIFQIEEIVMFDGSQSLHAVCKKIKVDKYYDHYAAYAIDVNDAEEQSEYHIIQIDKLAGPPINCHKTARGLNLIRPKQYC